MARRPVTTPRVAGSEPAFPCFDDFVESSHNAADATAEGLWQARARQWWVTRRRVGSPRRAAEFIDAVGFALLFPAANVPAPSLWEAVAGDEAEPFASGMGATEQKVWAWKDELPRCGQAWYGRFVGNRGSFCRRRCWRRSTRAMGTWPTMPHFRCLSTPMK